MAIHGNDNRGLVAASKPGVEPGRFGRMLDLPPAPALPEDCLRAIAEAMIKHDTGQPITNDEPVDENPSITAGYTYLGQFIDHDITFDPTPLNAEAIDFRALVDFRSPALDLDNLYSTGPDDRPYMYDELKLRLGPAIDSVNARVGTRNDLFRIPGAKQLAGEKPSIPVLGDKRNDENKIVSQLHGAFICFHNKVVDNPGLIARGAALLGIDIGSDAGKFRAAAAIVRWHYQHVVLFDYLDRITEPGMVTEVLNPGGKPNLAYYDRANPKYAYMPIEFSGAAFRFGHSMVRPSYALNLTVGTNAVPAGAPQRVPTFSRSPMTQNLNGFPGPLPDTWGIDWGYFLPGLQANAALEFKVPQASYRIDAILAQPLEDLPEFFGQTAFPWVRNLAFRNLQRGQELSLPSGQQVAAMLKYDPLPDKILWSSGSRRAAEVPPPGKTQEDMDATNEAREAVRLKYVDGGGPLAGATPLWYYILREAEYYGVTNDPNDPAVAFGGQHLGPIGSRIVAETLIGLLWHDKSSILHLPQVFKPFPEISGGAAEFTLDRLIAYALT